MKTNVKKFLALVLSMLMVVSSFSSLAVFAEQDTCEHTWSSEVITISATCEERGYSLRECTKCRYLEAFDFQPAIPHDYVEDPEQYVAPGCEHRLDQSTAYGQKVFVCSMCEDVQIEVLSPDKANNNDLTAHNWVLIQDPNVQCGEYCDSYYQCQNHGGNPGGICGYTTEHVLEVKQHNYKPADVAHKLPTCDEYGLITYTCQNENCPEKEIEVKIAKLPHELVDHEGQAPTCTEKGWYAYQTCKNCDYTTFKEIDVTEHNYVAVVTPATCTTQGYTTYTCADCPASYKDNFKNPLGHAKRVEVTTAPTCTTTGIETWFCWRCDAVLGGRDLPALGHDWSDWEVTVEADCLHEQTEERTCPVCKVTETRTGATGNHVKPTNAADITATVVKDSEHRENSYCAITYVCTVCKQPVIEAVEHRDMTYGEIQKAPTCTEEGVKADYCGACGYYKAEFVDPTGHNHVETVVSPTCTEPGYSTFKCACGDELEKGNFVDPLGHGDFYLPIMPEYCSYADEIKAIGILFKKPTCEEKGSWWKRCNACGTWVDATDTYNPGKWDALGHTPAEDDGNCLTPVLCANGCGKVFVEAKAAHTPNTTSTDCTVEVKCADCDYVFRAAKDHNPGPVATCKADQVCLDCGAVIVESSPNFHPQDGKTSGIAVTTFATCTEGASGTLFCHLCAVQDQPISWNEIVKNIDADDLAAMTDAEIAEATGYAEWIIALLKPEGHAIVKVDAKAPTCQSVGWDAYEYCSKKCGYNTYNELPVDPNAHASKRYHDKAVKKVYEGVEMGWARTPSCYADGLVWYFCDACKAADTTGTYNGWTETIVGSKLDCHKNIASYGTLVGEDAATCAGEGTKYYQCNHTYDTCDSTKTPVLDAAGAVIGWEYEYRYNTYTCEQIVEVKTPALPHVPAGFVRVSAATCTEAAVWKITCACGHEFTAEELAKDWPNIQFGGALGHDYVDHKAQDPTCTEIGWNAYQTCSRCDYTTYVELPALGHELILETGVTVFYPTCVTEGYVEAPCQRCDFVYEDTFADALGHKAPDATCTEASICTVCETEVAPALGHELILETGVTVFYPTCESEGYVVAPCQRCDFVYEETFADKLDHNYVETARTDSTCTVAGSVTYTCQNGCNDSRTDALPLAPHKPFEWNEGVICYEHMKAPTCSEVGYGFGSYCQYGYGTDAQHCAGIRGEDAALYPSLQHQPIDKLDHDEIDVSGKLSCTTAGFTYFMCQYCGEGHGKDGAAIYNEAGEYVEGLIIDYVHPVGHQPDGGKEPTCTKPGYTGDKCKECGCELGEITVIDPTNHPNLDWHNPAVKEAKCPDCNEMINVHGEFYVEDPTKREVWEYLDENYCRYTIYTIEYCTKDDCGYNHVNILYMENVNHAFELVDSVAATVSADGYDTFECKYCGHSVTKTNNRIANTVEFTFEVGTIDQDGNFVEGGKIVNGGKMAMKVDMAAYDVAMSQLMLTMKIDTDVLTFDEATTTDLNAANGFQNAYWAFDNGVVRAMTSKLEGSEDFVITSESGKGYLTLVFDVATDAYTKTDAFVSTYITDFAADLTNTEIVENDADPVAYSYVEGTEQVDIYKNADVSGDGKLDLTDAHMALDILSNRGYSVQADIDCDGEITYIDYMLMQMILLNEDVDDSAYVDFLNTYIAK